MTNEFYTTGAETALEDLQLVKVAFLAPAIRGIGKGIMSAGRAISGAGSRGMGAYGKHVSKPLNVQGAKAEKWLGDKATQHLGKGVGGTTKKLIKGVPGEILRQGVGGAAIGGIGGGAIGAATAEPGDRLSGALSGAGRGALDWGLMGAGAGLAGGTVRNVGRMGVSQIAKAKGLRSNAKEVGQVLKPGTWGQNVKDIATGKGQLGRAGAAGAALTGSAALGADFYATAKIDEALQKLKEPGQQTPPRPAQAAQQTMGSLPGTFPATKTGADDPYALPAGIVGSAIGGTAAGLGTSAALQALKAKKIIPSKGAFPELAMQIAPALASTAGSLTGYQAGRKLESGNEPVAQLKKLEAIDLDKLMRYYKKKPEVAQPAPVL